MDEEQIRKSFFQTFIKSEIIREVIDDIKKTLSIEITVVDINGKVVLPPQFEKRLTSDINEDFYDFIKNEVVADGKILKNKKFIFIKPARMGYIISPIYSRQESDFLGFLIGGPYEKTAVNDEETRVCEKYYKFCRFLNTKKETVVTDLDEVMLQTVTKSIDSYGRLLALLYEEKLTVQKNLGRLTGLYEISTSIIRTLDMQKVLQLVLDKAIELLSAENGALFLLDEEERNLRIFVSYGLDDDFVRNTTIKVGESLIGQVAREGKPKLLLKGVADTISGKQPDTRHLQSSMSVPLKSKGEVIGVLNIGGNRNNGNFTTEDLDLLQALGANAAAAIANARLYNQVQGKVRELSALFELGKIMVSTLDRKEVLTKVLANAIRLLHAEDGSLMLLDQEREILEIEVAHGLPESVVKETRIPLGEGIAGKVALEGKPRLLKKGIKDAESKTDVKAVEIPSALSVPLRFHTKIIGVLNVKGKKAYDPTSGDNFTKSDLDILTMLASQAAIAIENAELHKSLEDLFVNSIKALANAIEARDPYTRGHSERVTEYSIKIANYMNLPNDEIKKIRYAALLHDIGKINIKEEILNKPGRLTDEEFQIMHNHPTLGVKIMEPVKEFKDILPYMYHHHERYGAGGYPDGVHGEQIPLPARILAVADSFDAMTTDRPYRNALPLQVALNELIKNSGTQFDPRVVKVFMEIIEKEKRWVLDLMDSQRAYKEDYCED
ncbi:MAG: GAF domain-containing protein [Vulcanimicrobiota bacterium]